MTPQKIRSWNSEIESTGQTQFLSSRILYLDNFSQELRSRIESLICSLLHIDESDFSTECARKYELETKVLHRYSPFELHQLQIRHQLAQRAIVGLEWVGERMKQSPYEDIKKRAEKIDIYCRNYFRECSEFEHIVRGAGVDWNGFRDIVE